MTSTTLTTVPIANFPSARDDEEADLPLGEQAYIKLKRMILNGELKPGDQVNVTQLSEQMGLGKNPVHLATHRLARENLIEILPRKGILIQAETLDSFLALIESRELVEPFLAVSALGRVTPELIAQLQVLIDKGRACHENGDRQGGMVVDRQFHQTLYAASGNALLVEFANQLLDRSMRLWFTQAPSNTEKPNIEQLNALLEAIKAADQEATERLMREHIGSIRRKFLR